MSDVQFNLAPEAPADKPKTRINEIRIFDEINEMSANKFIEDFEETLVEVSKFNLLHGTKLPINVIISTPGGDVLQGWRIISRIERSPIQVNTIADGEVASMGLVILIAGHERFAYNHTRFLLHEVRSYTEGKLQDMKDNMKLTEELQEEIGQFITMKCPDMSKEWFAEKSQREFWFNNQTALDLGIIHKII